MTNVLLVEDDENVAADLTAFLKGEGFGVWCAGGQREALALLEDRPFHLALLDISLSEGNGFSLCRAIKSNWQIPVIFLTASGDEFSVVAGFDMGAEDYICKPFRPRELVSRMKNVLRLTGQEHGTITLGDVKVDAVRGIVTKQGREIFLSALEYKLLLIFASHKGMVLTRSKLLEEIWDMAGEFVNDNTLTVYIKRLREKIEDDSRNPVIIKTLRGIGYKAGE